MKLPVWLPFVLCAGLLATLAGCGKDFNGFGEEEGFGGYTKQFGNVDESYKPVGLCTYTGGCMTEKNAPNPGYGLGPPATQQAEPEKSETPAPAAPE